MSAATRGKRKLDETEENEIDLTADEPEPSVHATECTICCEKCTTSGEHRLASLACGHLFGHVCIEKWVKQSKTCPVCNQTVRRNDVRVLFTDCIAVVDNSRQEEWNQKYLAEKTQRTAMEMEVAKLKLQHAALQLECEKHKHRVMELLEENSILKAQATRPTLPQPPHPPWGYTKLASIPCVDARVCAIAPGCDLLCIGSKSSHPDHPHGLVQVSLMDLNHRVVIPLHRSAIRDIAISHDSAYIATTAMDAKLHITSPSAQKSILHFDMPGKLGWSCSWDDSNPHGIYVGHQNGHVSLFDMRRPGAAAAEPLVHHFQQPVHSVRTLSMGDQPVVVAATFSGLSVWTNRAHAMHMEVKNCCAMANNQMEPTQLVVSSRTTVTTSQSNATPAQHFVVSLKLNEDKAVETESDAVLQGHTTPSAISRSAIWSLPRATDQVLVASGDVQSHQLMLWDVTSSAIVRQYECGKSPVVDVQHAVQRGDWSSERAYLASLATDELVLYKAKTVAVHPVRIEDAT